MNTAADSAATALLQDDAYLERRIECARICMMEAKDDGSRRDHAERMRCLIAQRSPAQISRMEAKIEGLR